MARVRGFDFPDHLYYLMEHDAWARLDPDGCVTVGITSLGAHISGEFVEFMARSVGELVERTRALGMLEMSKVIRSMRAPVTGTLVETNDRVKQEPGLINTSPYDEGWLVRLRPTTWEHDSSLLVTGVAIPTAVESYMALLAEEFGENPP